MALVIGGLDGNARSVAALREARADLNAVISEIRAIPEFDNFLRSPRMSDIADAATKPLAYVSAAQRGGLALVVRRRDVVAVDLPALTRQAVHAVVERYLSAYADYRGDPNAHRAAWNAEIEATTRWLWVEVMGPVLDHVAGERCLWIVPGGLLGLLPLHVAWRPVGPSDREYALDRLEINYVPSAQALREARTVVSAHKHPRRILSVAPGFAHADRNHLPLAVPEAVMARRAFPEGPPVRSGLSPDDLRREMLESEVVHLACHGLADLESPLESRIVLGPQSVVHLRDLLPLNLGLRLVVLSACETLLPGTELPDEVLALPSGLLQAGVGGVVASSWVVPDVASAVVMIEFYRRWRSGALSPSAALRSAQQWVRDTPLEAKLDRYDAASRGTEDWPEPWVADRLINALLTDAAPESFDVVGWAAFGYVGA
jgi:CHAT domain-containing protein